MSVDFYGWEVIYDDDQHLKAEQEPKSGRLYTMYQGTTVQTARDIIKQGFQKSSDGMLGPGVYISRNQKKAERYPLKSPVTDRVVLKLRVDTGKVKRIDTDNHPMQKTWHSQGYDTAWVPPNCGMRSVPSGLEEDCVWDPSRIEVIDIALAPDTAIVSELRGLIAQHPNDAQNKSGRLYTMYQGTTVQTARDIIKQGFQKSSDGMLGPGVYISRNQKKAERYPLKSPVTDRVVLKLRVDTGKVKRIDTDNHPMQKTWHSQGYNTAWVPPNCGIRSVPSGLEEDCVWDPSRIEVIDIALAPDTAIVSELRGLIAQHPNDAQNKSGRLYTMYQGTTVQTARDIIKQGFQKSSDGMLGPGVYISRNQKKAERYPLKSPVTDRVVLKLRVDTGKVKRIDTDNHPMQKTWHSQGYDTAWVPPNCGMRSVPSGLEEDCVWDPSRIEVIDIALAPDTAIVSELRGLIAQHPNDAQNKSGRLYTMYQGTTVQTARDIIKQGFQKSSDGMLGPGVYISRNQKKAERYPLKSPVTDRVVLKLRVDTGKVKRIDTDNHPMQKTWHSQGYNTAWVPPNCGMRSVPSGLEEDCVWDPSRIEVIDIALAPDTAIVSELRGLIAQQTQAK